MNGFIQIPRDDPLWNLKPDEREVFLWFLREAAFKDHKRLFNGHSINEKRGQKTMTWPILSKCFNCEMNKMRRIVNKLVEQGFLRQVSRQVGRQVSRQVYVIVNYDTYQPPVTGLVTGLVTDHLEEGIIQKKEYPEKGLKNNDNGTKPDKKISGIRTCPLSFLGFKTSFLKQYQTDDFIEAMQYYVSMYETKMGKPHPRLKPEQWNRAWNDIQTVFRNDDPIDLEFEDIQKMIDKHFETEYQNCDYNILHFVTEGIMTNRFYEEVY